MAIITIIYLYPFYVNLQVFGKLIVNNEHNSPGHTDHTQDSLTGSMASTTEQWCSDTDTDLKEHMVSILFSRSKLSHLQKQVGTIIFRYTTLNKSSFENMQN